MWWGHAGFPFFPFIFLGVFVFFMIFRVIMFRRYGCYHRRMMWHGGPDDALAVLDRKLVNGEVTEEEYRRLKAILMK